MTPTDICNLALDAVPAGNIVNLDETSIQGRTCKKHFPQVLGELLEKGPWRFALKRVALTEMPANDRSTDWARMYAQPADMAWPVRVVDGGGYRQTYEYTRAYLYTNVPEAVVEYVTTGDLSDSQTALFRAALIANLAARLCPPITKDLKRTQFLANAAEVATQRAQAANHNLGNNTYGDHIPDIVADRLGLTFDDRVLEAPVTSYPDEDFVTVFEGSL